MRFWSADTDRGQCRILLEKLTLSVAVAGDAGNRRQTMPRKARKPKGFDLFNDLAKKLIQVPKAEVDRRIAARKKRKKK